MTEVRVTPGRCVTWKCDRVAHGPECEEHAAEPLPKLERVRVKYPETPEQTERRRARIREYMRRKRLEEPGYNSGWSHVLKKRLETTGNRE